MATQTEPEATASPQAGPCPPVTASTAVPTTYYFAYGSNVHLKQMKRRCPNSKYIGRARLANYRWQINERGYANVTEAEGHWVDGLVYEIDEKDEARLDVNEGVSKNAYAKLYMPVLLYRAESALYRRPTSWIVDKGGPAKACHAAKSNPVTQKPAANKKCWRQQVLVYASLTHIQDSQPKDEYVDRINLAMADALALGVDDDYVRNCVRPFIPERDPKPAQREPSRNRKAPSEAKASSRDASPRSGEPSPVRKGQFPAGPDKQTLPIPVARRRNSTPALNRTHRTESQDNPPPLPPRPVYRYQEQPIIVIEEPGYLSAR